MKRRSEDVKVTVRPLADIVEQRNIDRWAWLQSCMDNLGFVPRCVYISHAPYLLMQCLEMVRGSMAAGNWLDLAMDIYEDRSLDPDEVIFIHPFIQGYGVRLENRNVVRWEDVYQARPLGNGSSNPVPRKDPRDLAGDPDCVVPLENDTKGEVNA